MRKKDYIWIPAACSCESGKYLENIIDNSMFMYNEIREEIKSTSIKTIPANSNLTNFCILLAFLLITIVLLIAVSIYWMKYRTKRKHLLPSHITNSRFYMISLSFQ